MNESMNNEDIFKEARKAEEFSLSASEKTQIKNNVRAYMLEHPVQPTFVEQFSMYANGLFSSSGARSYVFGYRYKSVFATALILVCVGGSTVYAAEGALPGDALYPIKVDVSEKIVLLASSSAKAKAAAAAKFATRRLDEAEQLLVKRGLDDAKRVEIEARFDAYAEDFSNSANIVATKDNDVTGVAEVQSDFEASLRAHAAILRQLTQASSTKERVEALAVAKDTAAAPVAPLVSAVEAKLKVVTAKRAAAEALLAKENGTIAKSAATAQLNNATGAITDATIASDASRDSQGVAHSQISSEARIHIKAAQEILKRGRDKYSAGDYAGAFKTLQSAERAAQETTVSVKADTKLRAAITLPALSVEDEATSTTAINTGDVSEPPIPGI